MVFPVKYLGRKYGYMVPITGGVRDLPESGSPGRRPVRRAVASGPMAYSAAAFDA